MFSLPDRVTFVTHTHMHTHFLSPLSLSLPPPPPLDGAAPERTQKTGLMADGNVVGPSGQKGVSIAGRPSSGRPKSAGATAGGGGGGPIVVPTDGDGGDGGEAVEIEPPTFLPWEDEVTVCVCCPPFLLLLMMMMVLCMPSPDAGKDQSCALRTTPSQISPSLPPSTCVGMAWITS
jgi:hypothetical protein